MLPLFRAVVKFCSSRPSAKSFLIYGHILVLENSIRCFNFANEIAVKAYAEGECNKLFVL